MNEIKDTLARWATKSVCDKNIEKIKQAPWPLLQGAPVASSLTTKCRGPEMTKRYLKCFISLTQCYVYLETLFLSLPAELPPLWVELCSPKDVEELIPIPVNMIFVYRAFVDDHIKMR